MTTEFVYREDEESGRTLGVLRMMSLGRKNRLLKCEDSNNIVVEPNMVDIRFDSCFLLAENFPDALDWPSLPREGRRPDFLLLLARLR